VAKKSYGITEWKNGKPARFGELPPEFKPTRAQRKSTELMPWTKGPGKSNLKRFWRDAVG
jgi:hypothetical protein